MAGDPHDLPRWQSVYTYFRAWERDGTWHQLNEALRSQLRLQAGRNAQPSAGSVDSHSVKTASGGERTSALMVEKAPTHDSGRYNGLVARCLCVWSGTL
jgi:transposase